MGHCISSFRKWIEWCFYYWECNFVPGDNCKCNHKQRWSLFWEVKNQMVRENKAKLLIIPPWKKTFITPWIREHGERPAKYQPWKMGPPPENPHLQGQGTDRSPDSIQIPIPRQHLQQRLKPTQMAEAQTGTISIHHSPRAPYTSPTMVKLHHRTDIQKPPCSPPASQFLKYPTEATTHGCLGWQANDNNNDEAGQDGTDDMINLKCSSWELRWNSFVNEKLVWLYDQIFH